MNTEKSLMINYAKPTEGNDVHPVLVILTLLASLNATTNPWIYLCFSSAMLQQVKVRLRERVVKCCAIWQCHFSTSSGCTRPSAGPTLWAAPTPTGRTALWPKGSSSGGGGRIVVGKMFVEWGWNWLEWQGILQFTFI